MTTQSEYRPAIRWYLFKFFPVLPLAAVALLLYANNDMLWLVWLLTAVVIAYVFVVSYVVMRQMQTPVVALDDQGVHVRIVAADQKDFSWESISDAHESSFCIKLKVNGQVDSIPTNSLSSVNKRLLLSEIISRKQG